MFFFTNYDNLYIYIFVHIYIVKMIYFIRNEVLIVKDIEQIKLLKLHLYLHDAEVSITLTVYHHDLAFCTKIRNIVYVN